VITRFNCPGNTLAVARKRVLELQPLPLRIRRAAPAGFQEHVTRMI